MRGTAFQQRVWQALREIPPGATASYAEIAGRIGAPKAVRAVAQACARTRIAVAIPCHRVVRTRRRAVGLSLGRRAQARAARAGGRGMNGRAAHAPSAADDGGGRGVDRRRRRSTGPRIGGRPRRARLRD